MIELSVVIPTYNRWPLLQRSLESLERQTLARSRYEIVVVDDGSSDVTESALRGASSVRYIRQRHNGGPGAARNTGIRAAQGTYILFLGDDILASPELLEQHLHEHAQINDAHLAVLGYAPWLASEPITPLMRYLFDGPCDFRQFRYEAIRDPERVDFGFFYTCNLSLRRDFLLSAGLFDEDFRFAYGEDTELGYRLQQQGLRLVFRRKLVAYHDHLTTYRSARRRAHIAGKIDALMARKHPELVSLGPAPFTPRARVRGQLKRLLLRSAIDPLLDLADRRQWTHPILARAFGQALREHQWWSLLDSLPAELRNCT